MFNETAMEILKRFHNIEEVEEAENLPLPVELFRIDNISSFKKRMPLIDPLGLLRSPETDQNRITRYGKFNRVFKPDGTPKSRLFYPLAEFTQKVLTAELSAGFFWETSKYELHGATEVRTQRALISENSSTHIDSIDASARVYLISDDVVLTDFGHRRSKPYVAMLYSGVTPHRTQPTRKKLPKEGYLLRNMARLIVMDGFQPR